MAKTEVLTSADWDFQQFGTDGPIPRGGKVRAIVIPDGALADAFLEEPVFSSRTRYGLKPALQTQNVGPSLDH
jgi:hypothetical protein